MVGAVKKVECGDHFAVIAEEGQPTFRLVLMIKLLQTPLAQKPVPARASLLDSCQLRATLWGQNLFIFSSTIPKY